MITITVYDNKSQYFGNRYWFSVNDNLYTCTGELIAVKAMETKDVKMGYHVVNQMYTVGWVMPGIPAHLLETVFKCALEVAAQERKEK